MYWKYCEELRDEEAEQIYHEALAYCDVHDIGNSAEFLLGERAAVFEKLGHWDECLSITHAMLDEQSLPPTGRLVPLTYQAKVMARRGQDGYWPDLDEALRYASGLEEPIWLLSVHLARIEAYWLEGRTDAAAEELDRIRYGFGGVTPVQRGWLALWTRRVTGIVDPIDLEPFTSQLSGNGARAVESGIGSATAMRPHWRCSIRRRRPACVSRCPGLLILVPKRQRAWCAALCAILASEEFLLVLVRQQRHTPAASPHASNRFSNSFPKVSPTRRSQPHCSFRSGPSNTTYPRFSANSACPRVRARPRRRDSWT